MIAALRQILICCALSGMFSQAALAQATQVPNAKQQFNGPGGAPYASGTVDMYVPNTTTRKSTWQNSNQTGQNTNPITLDSAGRAVIFGIGSYRQVLKDRNGNTVWDAVTIAPPSSAAAATSGAGDFLPLGAIIPIAGFTAPVNYVLTYGQAINRSTYADAMDAITFRSSATCISGSTTLSGLSSTLQIRIGAPIEASCLNASTTVASITNGTSLVVSAAANASGSTTVRVFTWGNGDGSTTFNVPDYRGRVMAGRDTGDDGVAANRLTSTYYGATAIAPGAASTTPAGQSQVLINDNLPPYTPTGTNAASALTGAVTAAIPIVPTGAAAAATRYYSPDATGLSGTIAVSGTAAAQAFTGAAQGGTSVRFSIVQPTITVNYAIKVLNGTLPTIGVLSIGGMTGDVLCGTGISCSGSTISVGGTASPATLIGNPVNAIGTAGPFTISGLTESVTPSTTLDFLLIWDHSINDFKKVTPATVASANTSGVALLNGSSGTLSNNPANKVCYVSTAGLDAKSGLGWETAKLTLQACENLLATAGTVYVGAGTHTLSSSYVKNPGILTKCMPGAIIKRANSTDIDLVDAATNSPADAGFEGCTLDGNVANNTVGTRQILHIANANNFSLYKSTVKNGTGTGVYLTGTPFNARIQDNNFSNTYASAIYCNSGGANTQVELTISGNTIETPGFHSAIIENCDSAKVTDNKFIGKFISGIVVSGSGGSTTVTLTTGTTTGVQAGDAFIYVTDGGLQAQEGLIASVDSSVSLTLSGALSGTITNKPAVIGTGDMVSVDTSSKAQITNNQFSGGVTGGVVIFNGSGVAQTMVNTSVSLNSFTSMGGTPIGIFALAGQSITGTALTTNPMYNVGLNGSVIDPVAARGGIFIQGVDATKTWIDGHSIVDGQGGSSTLSYGIILDSTGDGQVLFGRNTVVNPANLGILNAFSAIALNGWGTGATSVQTSYGTSFTITVTAGTSPTIFPNIAMNTRATPSELTANYVCSFVGGTGLGTGAFVVPAPSAGGIIITYIGTPSAGNTYIFNCAS